jgi:SAM-dependent methyltransferase
VSDDWLADTRTSYDADAQGYADQVRQLLDDNPYLRGILRLFADLVEDAGDGRVVDVGCGPGFTTSHLSWLGVDVMGIDLSPEMVALARRQHRDVPFEVGDMTALDLDDRSVLGVLAFWSVIHVPDEAVPDVFAEFHRVLRPGGVVLVGFHVGDGTRRTTTGYSGAAIGVDSHRRRPAQVSAWLRDAGFSVEAELLLRPHDEVPGGVVIGRAPG